MLRAAVALLLLANLVFFAWTRGWYGAAVAPPRQGEREPGRIAAQVRPEAVVVLAAPAASAAVVAARAAAAVCLEAGPLSDAELPAAEAALAAAQPPAGSVVREALPPPPSWLVATARLPDAAVRRAREDDLRRFNANVETLTAPPELAPALVLSRHASKAEADAALAALAASNPPRGQDGNGNPLRGQDGNRNPLRGLRVIGLPPTPTPQWLRAAQADAELQARLQALPAVPLAGGFRPCAPRP